MHEVPVSTPSKAALALLTAFGSLAVTAQAQSLATSRDPVRAASAAKAVQRVKPATRPAGEPSNSAAPNVLIIMLDDAGYAQADTVGGEIHTPTLTRIADSGIRYNAFHTTAISSATRAALLTGRNHHHVANGTVTELASDHPGYNGTIPKTAATLPRILKDHGYSTAAFGKWHNTPSHEATPQGPFDHWPTAYGFDHFYGFNGGESDQYSPRLFKNTTPIEPPRDPKYHLTEDLAKQAVDWLQQHQARKPGQPFMMYWAPGAVHAPLQVSKEWSDKYKGKFDSGWDAYRDRAYQRQKAIGWIPENTVNTPRPKEMPAWSSLSADEKKFQARLMEVYAGFMEHTDTQAGKVVDALERLGLRDNTVIFYVLSDNGASSEGMQGAINDLVGLNGITTTPQQHMKALNETFGGLDALGGPKLEAHYHAAWAWAGESPFVGTKLVAGYFGGTRTPLAVSWPKRIAPDKSVRSQFHHVNDIAPTLYDLLGIQPPAVVDGTAQLPIDGVSMAYSFANAKAATRKKHQYFEIMGSRAEYQDGWIASVFGPRTPWVADIANLFSVPGKVAMLTRQRWIGDTFGWLSWKPENDRWALYDLNSDFSQSQDLAAAQPARLEALKKKFAEDASANLVNPIGASFDRVVYLGLRPNLDDRGDWHFPGDFKRLTEPAAPNIKSRNNLVTVDADFPANASGVLFSLGTVGGGLALYVENGVLNYEYNGFSLTRTKIRAPGKLPVGRAKVEVEMKMASTKRAAAATVMLRVNGVEVAKGEVPFTAPLAFSATGTFDVGQNLGSPVSLDYFDRAPFAFNGKIHDVHVLYK